MKKWFLKFIGFCGIGGIVTLLSMAMIAITNELFQWHPQLSYIFAYLLTLLLSYVLNSQLVFHSTLSFRKFAGYCGAYISGMLLGIGMLLLGMHILPDCNRTILSYAVIPATMLWNFAFINKFLPTNRKGTDHA